MFGGAAGGGKSDALLMAAVQYIDFPHYRGLILRRHSVDLTKSGNILDRANGWFARAGCHWRGSEKKWIFPSGATIQFGHMNNETDKHQYDGGEYHFIAFDEVKEFSASQYVWMFSRLRKTGNDPIPLRMRSATNPGGVSHHFLRDRFMSMEYARAFLEDRAPEAYVRDVRRKVGGKTINLKRWFIPSKVRDNPALNADQYEASLMELDPVSRARLLDGNWLITSAGRFKPEWFLNRYRHPNEFPLLEGKYELLRGGDPWKTFDPVTETTRYMTIDPAGTQIEREAEDKGRSEPSHSVISTWELTHEYGFIIWRDVVRVQKEFPEVLELIIQTWEKQGRPIMMIEYDGIGRPYYQELLKRGIPIGAVKTEGRDKLERAAFAANEANEGRIWLPEYAPWLEDLEAELFVWTGLKGEVADQIDTLSYAAICKNDGLIGQIILQGGIAFNG